MFSNYSANQCVISLVGSISNVGCQHSCFVSTPTVDRRSFAREDLVLRD